MAGGGHRFLCQHFNSAVQAPGIVLSGQHDEIQVAAPATGADVDSQDDRGHRPLGNAGRLSALDSGGAGAAEAIGDGLARARVAPVYGGSGFDDPRFGQLRSQVDLGATGEGIMSEPQKDPQSANELPKAEVKPQKWSFPVVWLVPVLAALVAGYLVYHRVREYGPKLTIRFRDATGLKAGETSIRYRGVPIGEVRCIRLSKDQQHAEVEARLQRSASGVAREGSVFWIVRPEIGLGNITGLGTIVAGPHIEVAPGDGPPRFQFVGLKGTPVMSEAKGLQIVLISSRLSSLKAGSPVYYRGIEVGAVQDARLSADATAVHIDISIKQRYASLIRNGTKFWNVSGVEMKLSLFRGAEVNVESLKSLVAGGITFASPNDPKDEPAKNGTSFRLYDEPKKEWLEWAPGIALPPEK